MNKPVKILLTFVTLAAVTWICGFFFFVFAFGGMAEYLILIMAVYLYLLFLIPATFARYFPRRKMAVMWLVIPAVILLTAGIRESIRGYHNSFERYPEGGGVDLELYRPFTEGTLAVRLDEPASLRLTDSLPRIDGATALYPIYAAFAQAVYPEDEYDADYSTVRCSTTGFAYQEFIQGYSDIIFVLGPSQRQLEDAERYGVEMVFTPIGREAFVFFVNSRNPVTGLSREQLREIYSGDIKNWQQIGGKKQKIRAFQRNEGSGSQTAFIEFMEGRRIMKPPRNNLAHGMGPIIERTANYANYPGAIGYTFRHYAEAMVANDGIKLLAVDGVYPTRETIDNGRYPLSATFYAVTRAGEANPNVERLVQWILSPEGQEIIRRTGYNPIE